MATHAISFIKNGSDIIEDTLRAAARRCAHIHVFDDGSVDGPWGQVQAPAKEFAAIMPWKQDPKPFTDGLGAEVFRHFRDGEPKRASS